MSNCRACAAPLLWVKTRSGKNMPLDEKPNPAGNVVLDAGRRAMVLTDLDKQMLRENDVLYMPHHATCPSWKKAE